MLLQLLSLEYDPRIGSLENGQIALLCALWSHIYLTTPRLQSATNKYIRNEKTKLQHYTAMSLETEMKEESSKLYY